MTKGKGRVDVAALMKERGLETERRISEYFRENPFNSGTECARELGISRGTVYRFIKKMKAKRAGKA